MDRFMYYVQKEKRTEIQHVLNPIQGKGGLNKKGSSLKNHAKNNYAKIKEIEESNRSKQVTPQPGSPKLFKMKKFSNVQSLFYKSYSNTPRLSLANSCDNQKQVNETDTIDQYLSYEKELQSKIQSQSIQENTQSENIIAEQEEEEEKLIQQNQQVALNNNQETIQNDNTNQPQEDEVIVNLQYVQSIKNLKEFQNKQEKKLQSQNLKLNQDSKKNQLKIYHQKEIKRRAPAGS